MPEKKKPSFLKSLRFRILIILVILGIVPSVIVANVMVAAYENKAVAVRKQTVEKQCDILCNLLIKENYMNDSSSQNVNSKLELLSNVYDGRILLVDRDYRIIKDTYGVDEGKTLISSMVIKCFKGEEASRYNNKTQKIEMAIPVKSPEVKQLQGAMLISFSSNEIAENIQELEQKSILITGIIIVLAALLGYVLSTVLVKPFARVTKSIEDLTDGWTINSVIQVRVWSSRNSLTGKSSLSLPLSMGTSSTLCQRLRTTNVLMMATRVLTLVGWGLMRQFLTCHRAWLTQRLTLLSSQFLKV